MCTDRGGEARQQQGVVVGWVLCSRVSAQWRRGIGGGEGQWRGVVGTVVLVSATVAVVGRRARNGVMVKQQDWTGKERTAEGTRRDETAGRRRRGGRQRAETDHARTHARYTPYQRQGIGLGLGLDSERLTAQSQHSNCSSDQGRKPKSRPTEESSRETNTTNHVHFTLSLTASPMFQSYCISSQHTPSQ